MKKFASLLLAVLMLCTMLSVFAMPASAAGNTTVMTETDTCRVKLTKGVPAYIEFTPSVNGNYTFISNAIKDSTGYPNLTANLYYKTKKIASDMAFSAGNGNFRITYLLEAGKTYKLEIQLKNPASCFADVSVFEEVIPESICEISGKCIIRQPGTYECDYFIVKENSTVTIDNNVVVKVKQGLANSGKIELLGKLDSYQAYSFRQGDISISENGSLVKPQIVPSYYRHIVAWHKNGGTIEGDSSTGDTYYSSCKPDTVARMCEIVKPGYSFLGWYDNPDFTGKPVTEIRASENGFVEFWAKYCDHDHFSEISIDFGKDTFVAESNRYYRCDSCGLYSEDVSGQNMIGNKNALDEWLVKWYNAHILSCRYIDVSLDASENVISAEKEINSTDFYLVNTSDKAWGTANTDTWYVCTGNVTVNNRIDIIGNVHLIIRDGCTLTAKNGIRLTENNTLSVYAQSSGEAQGKLVANGGGGNAAIGGSVNESCGTLNVCGTTVIAEGNGAVGIGGGNGINGRDREHAAENTGSFDIIKDSTPGTAGGNGGTVNVYAGTVTAKGSVGIGGGNGGVGGRGDYELGIWNKGEPDQKTEILVHPAAGSGRGGRGSDVYVFGGSVNATGDMLGIGGGKGGDGQADTEVLPPQSYPGLQYDFEVYAYRGRNVAAGTGGNGADGGEGGKLTVKGGTVTLNGKVKAAGGGNGGGTAAKNKGNGNPGSATTFDLENCVLKAGTSAESATSLNNISDYTNQLYLSVQYESVSALGSILSFGYPWIVIVIAVLAIGGVAALIIVMKKKKPALADGAESKDEE